MRDSSVLRLLPTLILSAILIGPPRACAANDDLEISVADGGQGSPAIAYDPVSEQYLVVFGDDRTGEVAIWGQRLEDLALAGENFCISSGPYHRTYPTVTSHPQGWFVSWRQDIEGIIAGQVISRDGHLIGDPILIVTLLDPSASASFAVATAGDGHTVIFSDRPEDGTIDLFLYAVFVGNDGSVSERRLISPAQDIHVEPDIARDPVTGRSLVVWSEDHRPDHTVFARWLSPDALPLGTPFVIDRFPFGGNYQCVAFGSDRREFLVVWPRNNVLRARRIAATGGVLDGEIEVSEPGYPPSNITRPALVYDDHAKLFRATYDAAIPHSDSIVVGRYVSPQGDPVGPTEPLQESSTSSAMACGLTAKGPQILTVWADTSYTANVIDIRGRFQSDDVLDLIGAGAVDTAAGPPADVLLVNGTSGVDRRVAIRVEEPITVSMQAPPAGPAPAPFVLYAWPGAPDGTTVTPHPAGLGLLCFPSPWRGGLPHPRKVWNNAGYPTLLGTPSLPSFPAPSIVFHLPKGYPVPIDVTLQGLIADHGSSADIAASRTNAIVLKIE